MNVKAMCKIINELRPDVDINVVGIFGKGINDRAYCYSMIYDSNKPPNFENLVTKDEEVSFVEIDRDSKLNIENVNVCFYMNKEGEMNEYI